LELLRRYRGLITNSQYLVRELARYELKAECVHPFVAGNISAQPARADFAGDPLRLIFAGRMSSLKGGKYLLEAAPRAQQALGRSLHVTFAGDGPARNEWEQVASRLSSVRVSFNFPGWLPKADLQSAIARSHLHVLPSIWPEPFGLSGLEAGLLGVPTVAFAVGGIPEWLHEGVNGHLAPSPATAEGLAAAITKALANREHHEQLRAGACREAQRYPIKDHLEQLIAIFERPAA